MPIMDAHVEAAAAHDDQVQQLEDYANDWDCVDPLWVAQRSVWLNVVVVCPVSNSSSILNSSNSSLEDVHVVVDALVR